MPRSSVASTSTGPATFGSTSRQERAPRRRAEQPRRLDVVRVADREHESANDARVRAATRRSTIASTALRDARPEHRRHDHREDDRREREDEVGGAHDRSVHEPAEVAGDRPERAADRRGERDEQERQRERHARAVEDAAEDVAAELVGAEEVLPGRGLSAARTSCASGSYGAISGAKIGDHEPDDRDRRRPMTASGWRQAGRRGTAAATGRAGAATATRRSS